MGFFEALMLVFALSLTINDGANKIADAIRSLKK